MPDSSPTEKPEIPPRQPAGFALLAKRISAWTTNGVLTVTLVVAGLSFGRQVTQWWAAEESAPLGLAENMAGPADPDRPHIVQFGDNPWSLHRQSLRGPRAAAMTVLRANCREATRTGSARPAAPGRAEKDLLANLARSKPLEQEPGQWQLWALEGSLPMMAGTRQSDPQPHPTNEGNVANNACRLVTLGLAVPTTDDRWTVYTFQQAAGSRQRAEGSRQRAEGSRQQAAGSRQQAEGRGYPPSFVTHHSSFILPPPPPDGVTTIRLWAIGGAGMVAFSGSAQTETWKNFYDGWFRKHGWTALGSWRRSRAAWHARFVPPADQPAGALSVRVGPDGRGGSCGLLIVDPPTNKLTESERS